MEEDVHLGHFINHRQQQIVDETGNTYIAETVTIQRCHSNET